MPNTNRPLRRHGRRRQQQQQQQQQHTRTWFFVYTGCFKLSGRYWRRPQEKSQSLFLSTGFDKAPPLPSRLKSLEKNHLQHILEKFFTDAENHAVLPRQGTLLVLATAGGGQSVRATQQTTKRLGYLARSFNQARVTAVKRFKLD